MSNTYASVPSHVTTCPNWSSSSFWSTSQHSLRGSVHLLRLMDPTRGERTNVRGRAPVYFTIFNNVGKWPEVFIWSSAPSLNASSPWGLPLWSSVPTARNRHFSPSGFSLLLNQYIVLLRTKFSRPDHLKQTLLCGRWQIEPYKNVLFPLNIWSQNQNICSCQQWQLQIWMCLFFFFYIFLINK